MDPNEALARIRAFIAEYMNHDSVADMDWQDIDDAVANMQALDDWIAKGGFLPDAWKGKTP